MTITTEHLIAAARAIGIEVAETPNGQLFINDDSSPYAFWNPEQDKSQLMNLQWELKIKVDFLPDDSGIITFDVVKKSGTIVRHHEDFDNTFESFATAIILAAAEIGRGME